MRLAYARGRLLGVSQSTVTRWMQKASPMITTGAAMR
jgi:hypothetical protein